MRAALLVIVVAASGCGGIFNTCDHPDEQELSCEALPPSSTEVGCMGRPGQDFNDPATHVDERYPVGCQITYPVCLGAYPDSIKKCSCSASAATMPGWACPI